MADLRAVRPLLAALALVAVACATGGVDSARVRSPATTAPQATSAPTDTPSATPVPTPTPGPGDFRVSGAMEHARVLSDEIGIRHAGTEGHDRAAAYIGDVLTGLGYEVVLDPFPLPQGGDAQNVIGRPPGLAPGDRYLIVGGHFDSLNGPGANDNATGVAASLEVARAVRAQPASLPVVVVMFGAEETQPAPGRPHHIGSQHFVDTMGPDARSGLVSLVNLDMVGWGDDLIIGWLGVGPREATERLLRIGGELGIPVRERRTPDWSDNGPFLKAELNAGWLWTGDDPRYHSVRDTFDHLQPRAVEWAGRVALATLRSYA